jgi:hypothetical protein
MTLGKVQMSCYLPREISRQLKVELARRELKFTTWVEQQARAELEALHAAETDAVAAAVDN